jgi:putative transcriptional regulator
MIKAHLSYLNGKLLVAMPGIGDPRFERTVIFMCAHSAEGAMGLVINRTSAQITFPELLEKLQIISPDARIELGPQLRHMPVQAGGPVESGRGFVLHTTDYFSQETTLPISAGIGLTATMEVLRAIAGGRGPRKSLMALGYSGWGPGQLEQEIQSNGWLTCDADEGLLFDEDFERRYETAMQRIGIDPRMLSSSAGHA